MLTLKLLTFAPVGDIVAPPTASLPEEIGPAGEALGNFPQAFAHLSLISAAYNLDRVLGSGV